MMKIAFMIVLAVSMAPVSVRAATYVVTNTNDSGPGSLRNAVETANASLSDDTIVFDISGCPNEICTIVLSSGELSVQSAESGPFSDTSGNVTVLNPSGPQHIVLSGNNTNRIFHGELGSDLTIEGITLEKGYSSGGTYLQSGGAVMSEGKLTLRNSVVRNSWSGYGAAIDSWNHVVLNGRQGLFIERTEVINNHSNYGAIYTFEGYLKIRDSTIANNQSGGIWVDAWDTVPHADILNSTLSGNGLYAISLNGSTMDMTNSTIIRNETGVEAGWFGGDAKIRNSVISENQTDLREGYLTWKNLGNNIFGGSPLLGPLAYNGGPTRTHALLPGSPAIDAGNNCVLVENGCGTGSPSLPNDQRGYGRNGSVDIGAYEVNVAQPLYTVSGRVIAPTGLPVRGAVVTVSEASGSSRSATTSSLGYFSLDDIAPGTKSISVASKRFRFATQFITVSASVSGLELAGFE
jgi:hypothetical protein